jgi:hypothetical protein
VATDRPGRVWVSERPSSVIEKVRLPDDAFTT